MLCAAHAAVSNVADGLKPRHLVLDKRFDDAAYLANRAPFTKRFQQPSPPGCVHCARTAQTRCSDTVCLVTMCKR
ncbi:hypothetical protein EBA01_06795 [Xanthomonas oryzae pv. oryzae]|nr:hypothetical protein AXO1947_14115 [Xanthomonas oryzae pv. oryzae]AUI89996.1 hypothetical protein BVV16_06975 [Xanthomonas oryzae pv. oryzae]AUI93673.1 hypothetical protein BVV17_06985 [Xanthomonas oryzae pv. oryzae]AUI97344.1 hypothetical protein BVV18_06995 [Xanthomonas oryzae pv. oryzae]AUJ01017.1 hypothetical protein BVV10_06995 [Xanthomonas oryzae pv. oryzae]